MANNVTGLIYQQPNETVFARDSSGNSDIPVIGATPVITGGMPNHGISSWRFVTTGLSVDLSISVEFADAPATEHRMQDADFLVDDQLTANNITSGVVTISGAGTVRVNLVGVATLPEQFVRFNITDGGSNGADTILQIRQTAQAYLEG